MLVFRFFFPVYVYYLIFIFYGLLSEIYLDDDDDDDDE